MKLTVHHDRKRSFISAWVLVGLLMLGYNGLNLASLLDQPLLGYSEEIQGIRQQGTLLEQLRALTVQEANAAGKLDLDQVFRRFEPMPVLESWNSGGKSQKKMRGTASLILPKLTGILRMSDPGGTVRTLAVINGRGCREKDRIQGFTIEKISEQGVFLSKSGKRWFVSVNRGDFSRVWKDGD